MTILNQTYELNNGILIPKIGFGTWLINNDDVVESVKNALSAGYRHIDTAWAYQNEEGVGKAIRESNVPRSDIFITTKVHADFKDANAVRKGIEESLSNLKLDYIDLLLIHAPKPWKEFTNSDKLYSNENLEVWKVMEEYYKNGKLKAIGVSNFDQVDLSNIVNNSEIKPMVNQILAHVGNTPQEVIAYSQSENILVEAYSPFGHGDVLKVPLVQRMAQKYMVEPTQLAVRYLLQLDLLPLPKASSISHIQANAQADFEISEEDMKILLEFENKNYSDTNKVFPVYQK